MAIHTPNLFSYGSDAMMLILLGYLEVVKKLKD